MCSSVCIGDNFDSKQSAWDPNPGNLLFFFMNTRKPSFSKLFDHLFDSEFSICTPSFFLNAKSYIAILVRLSYFISFGNLAGNSGADHTNQQTAEETELEVLASSGDPMLP